MVFRFHARSRRLVRLYGVLLLSVSAVAGFNSRSIANDTETSSTESATSEAKSGETAAGEATSGSSGASGESGGGEANAPKPKYPPFSRLLGDAEAKTGFINLWHKDGRVYAELKNSHLNRDFIVLISIARGIGQGQVLGGMSWGFGDDWIWQFRKVDDQIQIVRRNVRFRADRGSPEERAVELAYTDSILYSLPITTMSPGGGYVIDLNPVFMSDLPQISQALPGFTFSSARSSWAQWKPLKDNVELQVAATYGSSGLMNLDSVADSRGATINVHYSISALPQNSYRPRLADDRVGYFLTVLKDYSKKSDDDRFVRYINRWDLQKADPSEKISPPKKPIIFWIEKTVPYKYRPAVRDGILEWNKAFEKAGFVDAIEVRQQPDNADWDPEDINYNTFRWITASAGFAMGPSRVNPRTGQILDADIIFDADFLQFWKTEFETFTPASIAALTGGPLDLESYRQATQHDHTKAFCRECAFAHGQSREMAFGSAMALIHKSGPDAEAMQEKMIMQGLKEVVMHEVGHTLGLRHNFKASTFLSLEDLNDPEKTRETGLTASVMDYAPPNISPKGKPQGDYYSTTIGPYDIWAIEYGYKPLSGGSPESESAELKKIAARCGEAGLAFSTDEDTRGIDSDPYSNRWDLGDDPVAYARQRAELINQSWPDLHNRIVKDGDGYQRARQAFGVLLGNYGRAMHFASRYVGGVEVNRTHKGDKDAPPPFVVADPEKQRAALELLEEQVFSDKPFQFPPELYNYLAATRWSHWGNSAPLRPDYPVHDYILMWQERILDQVLSPLTLSRMYDSELKVDADKDTLTTAELINRLTKAVFAEVDDLKDGEYTNRKPAVSSLRRNLQRAYLGRLARLAMGNSFAPEDCQTIAFVELKGLGERMNKLLNSNVEFDEYTRAHLTESASRIEKVLDARIQLRAP